MKEDLLQKTKEEFICYFHDLWSDSKPLIRLFRTDTSGYIYDTGTNKIFACNDLEFNMLNNLMKYEINDALDITAVGCSPDGLLKTANEIRSIIAEKNVLKTKRSIHFTGTHHTNLEESIHNDLGMIQLEITERCNLRCAYCVYNSDNKEKRNHGTRDMTINIAKEAIDHLNRHSSNKDKIGVTFYGGEPLLCFPLIKSCVEYSRGITTNKELYYSITTNATLLTPFIAKYLSDEGFGVHVSIDGPQEIHDEYRTDKNGNGSFQRAISGLKMLYDVYSDINQITLSMVFTPPYTEKKMDRISELWDEISWLPRKIGLSFNYAQGLFPDLNKKRNYGHGFNLIDWAGKKFIENYQNGSQAHPIVASVIEKEMAILMQRNVYSSPSQKHSLNGCCIPAARKQFVNVDGTLIICERIGMAPAIGNVNSGVDIKRIRDIYVKVYSDASLPFCSECWAQQLCSICYLHAFSNGQFDINMKNRNCVAIREKTTKFLSLYCRLLEIRRTGLDYLLDWEIL